MPGPESEEAAHPQLHGLEVAVQNRTSVVVVEVPRPVAEAEAAHRRCCLISTLAEAAEPVLPSRCRLQSRYAGAEAAPCLRLEVCWAAALACPEEALEA